MKACEWGGQEARDKLTAQINAPADGIDPTAKFLMNLARAGQADPPDDDGPEAG